MVRDSSDSDGEGDSESSDEYVLGETYVLGNRNELKFEEQNVLEGAGAGSGVKKNRNGKKAKNKKTRDPMKHRQVGYAQRLIQGYDLDKKDNGTESDESEDSDSGDDETESDGETDESESSDGDAESESDASEDSEESDTSTPTETTTLSPFEADLEELKILTNQVTRGSPSSKPPSAPKAPPKAKSKPKSVTVKKQYVRPLTLDFALPIRIHNITIDAWSPFKVVDGTFKAPTVNAFSAFCIQYFGADGVTSGRFGEGCQETSGQKRKRAKKTKEPPNAGSNSGQPDFYSELRKLKRNQPWKNPIVFRAEDSGIDVEEEGDDDGESPDFYSESALEALLQGRARRMLGGGLGSQGQNRGQSSYNRGYSSADTESDSDSDVSETESDSDENPFTKFSKAHGSSSAQSKPKPKPAFGLEGAQRMNRALDSFEDEMYALLDGPLSGGVNSMSPSTVVREGDEDSENSKDGPPGLIRHRPNLDYNYFSDTMRLADRVGLAGALGLTDDPRGPEARQLSAKLLSNLMSRDSEESDLDQNDSDSSPKKILPQKIPVTKPAMTAIVSPVSFRPTIAVKTLVITIKTKSRRLNVQSLLEGLSIFYEPLIYNAIAPMEWPCSDATKTVAPRRWVDRPGLRPSSRYPNVGYLSLATAFGTDNYWGSGKLRIQLQGSGLGSSPFGSESSESESGSKPQLPATLKASPYDIAKRTERIERWKNGDGPDEQVINQKLYLAELIESLTGVERESSQPFLETTLRGNGYGIGADLIRLDEIDETDGDGDPNARGERGNNYHSLDLRGDGPNGGSLSVDGDTGSYDGLGASGSYDGLPSMSAGGHRMPNYGGMSSTSSFDPYGFGPDAELLYSGYRPTTFLPVIESSVNITRWRPDTWSPEETALIHRTLIE